MWPVAPPMRFIGSVICLVALLLASSASPQSQADRKLESATPPNIFLITIDTLRADHVHCYGYDHVQTPALDSLAHDGVRFANAFTASPITNSSHATILTGELPSNHGVTDFGVSLSAAHPTWAELLKTAGYTTSAFIGAAILDSKTLAPGFDRGFDFYDNFPQHAQTGSRWDRVERRGMEVVNHAERWSAAHASGPQFVWVHLYDPHDPYEPPRPYSETYKNNLYDGEIAYADSALLHFLDFLKQRGTYQNALVIVVGDHGEGLGEHGEQTHGIFLYDSTLHVPLIIKLPGNRSAGSVVSQQVRTPDILPTVLDLLSPGADAHMDGRSLVPLFGGAEAASRAAIGQTDYPLRFGWSPLSSVRADGFKFIEAPRPELYDLQADPKELHNVYEPWNAQVQKLRSVLAQLPKPSRNEAKPGAVPESTVAELSALGYLGPEGSTNVPQPSLLPDPKDKIEQQNLLHTAMLAADADRISDAQTALQKLLTLEPKSAPGLMQLGSVELKAGSYSQAASHFQQARALRPDDPTLALHYGEALLRSGDLAHARDALEASLRLNPRQAQARALLGTIDLRQKKTAPAQDEFEAALLLAPEDGDVRVIIARAWLDAGRPAEAVSQLHEALKLRPDDASTFDLLARAYTRQGNKLLAARSSRRAAELRAAAKNNHD